MGRVTIIRVPSLYAGYIFISLASRFVMSRQRYNPSLLPGIKVSNLEKRLKTFNIKKMCAKMLKARKEGITVAKSMFIGLFIPRYNWKITTCYQINEKKVAEAKEKITGL